MNFCFWMQEDICITENDFFKSRKCIPNVFRCRRSEHSESLGVSEDLVKFIVF